MNGYIVVCRDSIYFELLYADLDEGDPFLMLVVVVFQQDIFCRIDGEAAFSSTQRRMNRRCFVWEDRKTGNGRKGGGEERFSFQIQTRSVANTDTDIFGTDL